MTYCTDRKLEGKRGLEARDYTVGWRLGTILGG